MKNKYLVTTDLDETLLDSNSRILDESISFIQSFINDGNHFLINTGRPHQSAINFLKMMGVHEPMICSNGSAIVTYSDDYTTIKDYILFAIEHDLMKSFLKEIKPFVYGLVLNTIKNVYSYDFSKVPCWVVHESDLVKKVCGEVEEIFQGDVLSVECYISNEHLEEFKKIFSKEKYTSSFFTIFWGCYDSINSFEIHARSATKGKALLYMEKYYDIPHENTFAFGDSLNDLPMLQDAHYGVAMINA
ncbi:MAG: HAD-IIB family hydrolase, partial [Bacillales bacterium]|nr:HAD-IIB family hydrolase [Bacillales bacterium]